MDSELNAASYAAVAAIADQLGRKFEEHDLIEHPDRTVLIEAAGIYTSTYSGTFDFMLNLKHTSATYGLSARQAKGALNTLVAEFRRQQTVEQRKLLGTPTKNTFETRAVETYDTSISDGRYTVGNKTGGWHTFKIKPANTEKYENLPEGTRMVLYLSGPSNESDYTAMAWLYPNGFLYIYRTYQNDKSDETTQLVHDLRFLLGSDATSQSEARMQYALASGRCAICGRTLTVPASIHRGIGPECAGKLGM